jgi:hypothetical protein
VRVSTALCFPATCEDSFFSFTLSSFLKIDKIILKHYNWSIFPKY